MTEYQFIELINRIENNIAVGFFIWILIYIALKIWEITKD
jgi:hypothetical protein